MAGGAKFGRQPMIIIKSEKDLELMRPACRVARQVLDEVINCIKPGVTTRELDDYAAERIKFYGGRSAFYGYRVGRLRFPCHTCISVNNEVVHGLAGDRRLVLGDLVSVDVGVFYNGFVGDNARTVAVGGCTVKAQRLLDVTEAALFEGIAQARPGNCVADISRAVQQFVESNGFSVVREFVGHGVGRHMHEEPQVPNYVEHGRASPRLRPGMTLAIEPMVNAGGPGVKQLDDGWTVVTADGDLSAHFEHTILVTESEPEILTCPLETPSELKAS
jgi:methionyl aminopeptidase